MPTSSMTQALLPLAATGTIAALLYRMYSMRSARKRFVVLSLRAEVDSAVVFDAVSTMGTPLLVGADANAECERWLCGSFTHCAVLTAPSGNGTRECKARLADLNKATVGGGLLALDYEPNVALECPSPPARPLRHVFFARFKPRAPVAELIAGYSGLPTVIKDMKAFEWGVLRGDAEGYTHIFMTTFANEGDRDIYLAHEAHDAFAAKIFSWIDKLVVFDFFDVNGR
jgi:hypothetical protein